MIMNAIAVQTELERFANELKQTLQQMEILSQFCFTISISGRVHDGETLIAYKLNESEYASGDVEGNRINAVVNEYMRRQGWNVQNAPKTLPAPYRPSPVEKMLEATNVSASKALDDEIPF